MLTEERKPQFFVGKSNCAESRRAVFAAIVIASICSTLWAEQPAPPPATNPNLPTLPETVVEGSRAGAPGAGGEPTPSAETSPGRGQNLLGSSDSASQGSVNREEVLLQPRRQANDILELVPGLVVAPHTGSGDAGLYYLRGFALDHGTDFSTFIDNMPMNLPTHAHGQGFTDLNSLIPELVDHIDFRHALEQLPGQMTGIAAAGRAIGQLARLRPG